MADTAIRAKVTAAAPLNYVVAGGQEIIVKTVYGVFDGTGAGTAFYPTIRLLAPGGDVVGEYRAEATVAAGASAQVTWFPGVTESGDIRFNVDNEGGYLDITTNNKDPNGYGFALTDLTNGGILVHGNGGGGVVLEADQANNPGVSLITRGASNSGLDFETHDMNNAGFNFTTNDSGNGGFAVNTLGASNGGIALTAGAAGGIALTLSGGGQLLMSGLPTANPGGSHRVWNNGGVLNIT
jgi:hypothetical protein